MGKLRSDDRLAWFFLTWPIVTIVLVGWLCKPSSVSAVIWIGWMLSCFVAIYLIFTAASFATKKR